jgi:hypothetical protein
MKTTKQENDSGIKGLEKHTPMMRQYLRYVPKTQ